MLVPELADPIEPRGVRRAEFELLDADVAGHDLFDGREPVAAMGEQLQVDLVGWLLSCPPRAALGSPFEGGQHHRERHDEGARVGVGRCRQVLIAGGVDAEKLCGY